MIESLPYPYPYLRLIAENNFAEAYFGVGRRAKSRNLVTQNLQLCKSQGDLRLFANGLHIRALLQDYYRPLRTREIFAVLFPNEEFEPSRSDDRVHQCIARLSQWISKNSVPLKINQQEGGCTCCKSERIDPSGFGQEYDLLSYGRCLKSAQITFDEPDKTLGQIMTCVTRSLEEESTIFQNRCI